MSRGAINEKCPGSRSRLTGLPVSKFYDNAHRAYMCYRCGHYFEGYEKLRLLRDHKVWVPVRGAKG